MPSMRGSHPLPDQLPGEHTGPQATNSTDPLFTTAFSAAIHTHTHTHTHGNCRWLGMWWLGMFQQSTHVLLCAPII